MKFLLAAALLTSSFCYAQSNWSFELATGSAFDFHTNLKIERSNEPSLDFNAHYETRGFKSPLYYSWRVGRWSEGKAWEVEFVHHKIFITNPPANVQSFSVSHGYNLLTTNFAVQKFFIIRAGGGVVIAHPESTIGGVHLEEYHLTGPCGQIAISKRFYFSRSVFVNLEGKFTAARAKVPVANGNATTPNVALHGLFGIGVTI